MKNIVSIIPLFLLCLFTNAQQPLTGRNSVIKVKADAITYLYGTKASKSTGDVSRNNGDFLTFSGTATIEWVINVAAGGTYEINFTYGLKSDSSVNNLVEIETGKNNITQKIYPTFGAFGQGSYERILLKEKVEMQAGEQLLALRVPAAPERKVLNFRCLELIPMAAKQAIQFDMEEAEKSRANTEWLNKAGYGVMFHWTSQSVNKDGTQKPYELAVKEFNLGAFVNMVTTTGAAYVIFTIGHAEPFCPAPIKSWENYHPGHTTKRDLVAEMADALSARGIKLLCYFPTHIIAKYKKATEKEFTEMNKNIITEFGERYGKKIAGYWFDGWYQCYEEYPGFSFKDFFKICKAGNPDRIVALNSWIYPPVTEWQEYWAGETASPVELPVAGTLKRGPGKGLRYQALLIMEPYWVQEKADIPDPRFTSDKLSEYILNCKKNGGAVTINMGIYQDGTVGTKALEVMKEVRKRVGSDR
ncbi:MAG: alpha-L-fucosidase [Chitinophagaceae bacterium]